jgi:4-amino-4-deoxy-L-arabinose transferase-like glycosyltransferase
MDECLRPGPSRWVEIAVLGFLCLAGLGLRIHALDRQSIWIDEAYSLDLAGKGLTTIVAETARDNHPPLYYLLLAAWTRVGSMSETWARLLSAVLGAALIVVFHSVARQILDRGTALVATAILAFSPFAVWHSQDARMYPLMLLATYLALSSFLVYVRGGPWWSLGVWVTSLIAAFYTHLYALFMVPVLLVHLVSVRRDLGPRRMSLALVGLGTAVLACLPWIWIVLTGARHEAGFYKPIGLLSIPYAFYAFSVGYSLGPSIAQLHNTWQRPDLLAHLGSAVPLAAVLFGGAFTLGMASARRHFGRYTALAIGLVAFPVALPVLVTSLSRVDFNARYAITAFPAFLMFVSAGIVTPACRVLRVALAGGIAALLIGSLANHYGNEAYAKEDARSAERFVERRRAPGDCVLVIGIDPAYRYYAGGARRMEWLDFGARSSALDNRQALDRWRSSCPRLWFVSGREWEADPLGVARTEIERYFQTVSESVLPGVRILEMKPREGDTGNAGS